MRCVLDCNTIVAPVIISVELSANLREVSQCPEKASTILGLCLAETSKDLSQ